MIVCGVPSLFNMRRVDLVHDPMDRELDKHGGYSFYEHGAAGPLASRAW